MYRVCTKGESPRKIKMQDVSVVVPSVRRLVGRPVSQSDRQTDRLSVSLSVYLCQLVTHSISLSQSIS